MINPLLTIARNEKVHLVVSYGSTLSIAVAIDDEVNQRTANNCFLWKTKTFSLGHKKYHVVN